MKVHTNGHHKKNGRASLEERVSRLELEVECLVAHQKQPSEKQGWQAIVGTHADSPAFEAICREVERLRAEDYARAAKETKSSAKRRTVKSKG